MNPLLAQPWLPLLMSYAGLLLDLLVMPLLLWRPARPWAYAAAAFFHLSNVVVFGSGTFPWFLLLMTALFFDPVFPRRLPGAVGRWFRRQVPAPEKAAASSPASLPSRGRGRAVVAGLTVHGAVQGHNFAWHMMLRSKTSTAVFRVQLAADSREEVADLSTIVSPAQARFAGHPDCLLQVAHWLAAEYQAQGRPLSAVFVDSRVALNGRPARPLIGSEVNLRRHQPTLAPATWLASAPE